MGAGKQIPSLTDVNWVAAEAAKNPSSNCGLLCRMGDLFFKKNRLLLYFLLKSRKHTTHLGAMRFLCVAKGFKIQYTVV